MTLVQFGFLILLLLNRVSARLSKIDKWGNEALGEYDFENMEKSSVSAIEVDVYKRNLLQYVLQTGEPKELSTDVQIPYVMDKLYSLLADKSTGREKRSAPFEVDFIRGLEDHYGKWLACA